MRDALRWTIEQPHDRSDAANRDETTGADKPAERRQCGRRVARLARFISSPPGGTTKKRKTTPCNEKEIEKIGISNSF
jgi:hypothetical protein